MASSLDEIQGYDLFQFELESKLESFLRSEDHLNKKLKSYMLNVFIEFVSFNKFIESSDEITNSLYLEFEEWLKAYNTELESEKVIKISQEFITFVKSC